MLQERLYPVSKPHLSGSMPSVSVQFGSRSSPNQVFARFVEEIHDEFCADHGITNSGTHALAADHSGKPHPDYLKAFLAGSFRSNLSYSKDEFAKELETKVKNHFGRNTVFLHVPTGTAANNLALSILMDSTDKIFASDICHTHILEGNAVAVSTQTTPVLIPSANGKLTVKGVETALSRHKKISSSPPKVLYIAQPTEIGTLYEPDEIRALADLVHENDMLLFVDGARFWNAAARLREKYPEKNYSLKNLTVDLGVDAMTLGGTKNGMVGCESVMLFNNGNSEPAADLFATKGFTKRIENKRRQLSGRQSKASPFLAQYIQAFKPDQDYGVFGVKLAAHANKLADTLYKKLLNIPGVRLVPDIPQNANGATVLIPQKLYDALVVAGYPGYTGFDFLKQDGLENYQIVRYMTSPTTTGKDVKALINAAKQKALEIGLYKDKAISVV